MTSAILSLWGRKGRHRLAAWAMAALVMVIPPDVNLIPLGGLWIVTLATSGVRCLIQAVALSVAGLTANVVLYAGL